MYRSYGVVTDARRIPRVGFVPRESIILAVVAVETATLGPDPENSRTVFVYDPRRVVTDAVDIVRIVDISREDAAFPVEAVEPQHRADPEVAR